MASSILHNDLYMFLSYAKVIFFRELPAMNLNILFRRDIVVKNMNIQQVMQPNRNSPQMKSVAPGQARWRWRGGGSLGDLSKNCQF